MITMVDEPARDPMLDAEIVSLRNQIGEELGKRYHVSGLNLSLGNIDEDYVPELRTIASRMRIFDRMANDPQVRGQLRAITMTIVSSVRWKCVEGSPAMRELIDGNLLGTGDPDLACSSSWLDILHEAFGCLIHGFSMWGLSWDTADGRLFLRDLCWLHPRSVDEDGWVMDAKDNLLAVRRTYTDALGQTHPREATPADELFILPWDSRGPNWEGNAFIRPMYRPWKLGELAEKIDMIDLQNRGVGIPMAKLSASGGLAQRNQLVEILKSMRGGSKERAFICLGTDESVEFLTSNGTVKDAAPILEYHRSQKVKAGGTEYFEQGNTATGSRAGASALATGFFINVNGIRVIIEDKINKGTNRQPGLVKRIIDANFSREEIRKSGYCRITGSTVSPTEQLDNVPLMQDAVAKGMLPPNLKHANELSRLLNWPQLTQAEWDAAMEAKRPVTSISSPANGGPGRPNEAGPDGQGRDDREGRRLGMGEKKTPNTGENSRSMNRVSYPWNNSIAGG